MVRFQAFQGGEYEDGYEDDPVDHGSDGGSKKL
jgi:hypothetical protein